MIETEHTSVLKSFNMLFTVGPMLLGILPVLISTINKVYNNNNKYFSSSLSVLLCRMMHVYGRNILRVKQNHIRSKFKPVFFQPPAQCTKSRRMRS